MEHLEFANYQVEIQRKAFRRSLSLTVSPCGKLCVKTGQKTSKKVLSQFLHEKQSWIEKAQSGFSKLRDRYPKKLFESGEEYTYLGTPYRMEIQKGAWDVQFQGANLVIRCPEGTPKAKGLKILKAGFEQTGKTLIRRRVAIYSPLMKLYPKQVSFRAQKSLWGSCSWDNRLSLNWKLVVAPLWVIDYVVIHELAHMVHKNHSKKFWQLVARYTTYADKSRIWLRENHYACDFLAKKSELWPEVTRNDAPQQMI